jgi:soluble lytic murein transglycosylase
MLSRYRHTTRMWSDPIGRALFRLRLRPNHLTVMGLAVSLVAAAAFVTGHVPLGGLLVLLAGLFDFCDGSLARASGQVTPFGGFLDSVIDRYSDLVVLLGIVVLFSRVSHMRGAVAAMAALVGSLMVSYTKARAESIGVECNVGFMERPERMICLIGGALFGILEPALWVLAVLANITAVHRILFTRRMTAGTLAPAPRRRRATSEVLVAILTGAGVLMGGLAGAAEPLVSADTEKAWARAVDAYQRGDVAPLVADLGSDIALASPIGDYARYLVADAMERRHDVTAARAMAVSVADRHPQSRLAPRGLLMGARLASHAGDDATAQALVKRLIDSYPEAPELSEALYLLGQIGEARGQRDAAALAYRELRVLAPATGWADGAEDRLAVLASDGVQVPPLSMAQRLERAERLLRGGVAVSAVTEAEVLAGDAPDAGLALRALRVVAAAAQRLGRYDVAARAIEMALKRAPHEKRVGLQLDLARAFARAADREKDKPKARALKDKALGVFATVVSAGTEAEASEAAYLRARLLDGMGRTEDAASAYRAVATRYPNRDVAGEALWHAGLASYAGGNLRSAEGAWSRLAEIPGGRAHRMKAVYWTGRVHEATAGLSSAEPFYQRVQKEAPRSYYGMLASRRGAATAHAASDSPVRLPDNPIDAVATDPGFARVDLLRRIGLVEFAWEELEDLARAAVGDTVRLYGLTSAYVRDERYHLALRILRRHFTALAAAGHTLPQAFWEMLYPFGWRPEVFRASEQTGLDPYLIAAVVREESSYHPRAVSRAGARGLMQLMPGTAQPMAQVRGWPFRDGALLDDPSANIQMGTAFLASLVREFPDPRIALAAYNAGPRRVREWWKARKSDDIDAWVELIPFDETRGYVKRVTLSWDEYRRIYSGR